MKIGIVTFWESTDNYGQVLQAYALQQVLKDMGHEPFQIKYSLKASQGAQLNISLLKKIVKTLLIYPILRNLKKKRELRINTEYKTFIEEKNKVRRFSEFRKKYITQGDRIYNSIEELRSNPPQADCYITGSDQVWTMLLNDEGNAGYFLDFGNKETKRISYAASFGRSAYPTYLQPRLKGLLNSFDAISVREEEGVEICRSLGINSSHVLDPTLLLNKSEYNDLTKDSDIFSGIFVYSINVKEPSELYWDSVVKYANSHNSPITVTTSSGNFPGREIYEGVSYQYATIPEWINCIKNASHVVTTSFHGVAFCILMHTNFVYVPLQKSGSRGNGRVESLLNSLEIGYKICHDDNMFENIIEKEINWFDVDKRIELLRIKSYSFLKNALNK